MDCIIATLAGGKAVYYVCDEQAEVVSRRLDDIKKKIMTGQKAIVIINPEQSTEHYPRKCCSRLSISPEIIEAHNLYSDEIYDPNLVMDEGGTRFDHLWHLIYSA